jgi:uncharacterized membrane protein
MARATPPPSPNPSVGAPFRTASLILLGIAALVSAWLVYQSLQSGPVPGCTDGDCGVVLSSKWAKVFGIPVGLFGTATYLAFVFLAARPFRPDEHTKRVAAAALLLLIPAAGLWFAGLQLFVIHAFCKWCSATHAIATTGAILMALAWHRESTPAPQPASPTPPPPAPSKKGKPSKPAQAPLPATALAVVPSFWGTATALAAVAFVGFTITQALSPEPPKRRILTASMSTPTPASSTTTPTPVAPQSAENASNATTTLTSPPTTVVAPPAAPSAAVSLHDGKFVLQAPELPRYGALEAPHRFVMISDYTCVHCRHANRILAGVRESFGPAQLAVLMLPTHHGGDSLELQELMLTAWQLDPKVWSDVATEMYYDRLPPKTANVRPVLEARLGATELASALKTHAFWSSNLISTTKLIIAANREKTKSGSIPQFIIGSEIVVGSPEDEAEFFQLLDKNLGLVRERFPEMSLASTNILIGRVFAGTSRMLTLGVTNTGASALQISRATPPPGGRVLRGLQTPIAPGETSALEIALAAPREPGPFSHQLVLYSNARSNETRVQISGLVWKPIRINPATLDFGRLDPDNTKTQGVLRLEFDEPARVASVRSQNPGFAATLRTVNPGTAYDIEVSTTPSLGFGNQQATLMVVLEKPVPEGWPESLAFAARATVDRSVTVVPQRITLPSGPLTTERHLQTLVRCSDTTPDFKVISAVLEGGPSFAQPEIQPAGGANGTIVRFTLPGGWAVPPPPAQARLVIHTTHPKFPTLEVPFVTP